MPKNIFLMGIKSVGKSTLGKMLAEELNKKYYDTDLLIEEFYAAKKNLDTKPLLREIYKKEGLAFFKELEASVCKWVQANVYDAIVSLGGGVIENQEAIDSLVHCGTFVYLKDKLDVLYQRIITYGIPPFLEDGDPYTKFTIIYKRRHKLYQKMADIIIDLKGADIDAAFKLLISKLG